MKTFTSSFLFKLGLITAFCFCFFSAHAQVTDQAVVNAFPDLTDGTFVIGATGAYDVDTNEDVTLHAVNADTSLTLQNGSNYTSNDHDIILTSWRGSAATLNITGGIIDLGSGDIVASRDEAEKDHRDAYSYVNITGGTVNVNRFRLVTASYNVFEDFYFFEHANLHVNISGQGTSLYSQESADDGGAGNTLNITISDGAVYNMKGSDGSNVFYSIEDGGTLESRGLFSASNLNFASGGTLRLEAAGNDLDPISSGQTVVLNGGYFGDATTLAGGTLKTGAFDMSNLTFTSGTLEATGVLTNLGSVSSGQTVVLDGGYLGDATTLAGGTLKTGAFDMSNLTFSNGTLEATGAITNLDSLSSSGQTVILDGGTWSPSGNIDAGNLTLQNSSVLTVGDFNATNLTFTDGTLEATGTLKNLTELDVNQTVKIDGSSANLQINQNLNVSGGTLNILNGGKATAASVGLLFSASGGTVDIDGGTLNVASMDTVLTLNENTSITGNGTIFGDVNLGVGGSIDGDTTGLALYGNLSGTGTLAGMTVYGNVDIGNSPGELELQGTTLASGTVTMEISGTGDGEFDTLIGDEFSDVSGANLNISFVGFTPLGGESWQLITGGIDPSSFNSINTPENYALSGNGTFTAIPEPATILMFACVGLAAVIGLRRRR